MTRDKYYTRAAFITDRDDVADRFLRDLPFAFERVFWVLLVVVVREKQE